MINELIDQANNILNFENQTTQLTSALNKKVDLKDDQKLTYIGFKLALNMVEQHPQLIRPTLYGTMKVISNEYKQLTKFTYNHKQMSAVSLAVNHLRNIGIFSKITEQSNVFIEQQLIQMAEEEKVKGLAHEIKMMLFLAKQKKVEQPIKVEQPKPKLQPIIQHKLPPTSKWYKEAIWVLKVEREDCQTAEAFFAGYIATDVAKRIGISASNVRKAIKEQKVVKGYKIWLEA